MAVNELIARGITPLDPIGSYIGGQRNALAMEAQQQENALRPQQFALQQQGLELQNQRYKSDLENQNYERGQKQDAQYQQDAMDALISVAAAPEDQREQIYNVASAEIARKYPDKSASIPPYQQFIQGPIAAKIGFHELAADPSKAKQIQTLRRNEMLGIKPGDQKYEKLSPGEVLVDPSTGKQVATGGKEQIKPEQITAIRKELNNLGSNFQTVSNAYASIQQAAQNPTAAGDMALIFGFMKILDPGSVVREGEFANAQNTAGVPDQIRNAYNRALSGQRLNPNQRTDFVGQAKGLYESQKRNYEHVREQYRGLAQRNGIDFNDIAVDFSAQLPPQETVSAPSQEPQAGTNTAGDQSFADALNAALAKHGGP